MRGWLAAFGVVCAVVSVAHFALGHFVEGEVFCVAVAVCSLAFKVQSMEGR